MEGALMTDPERIPVIIGVGQLNDRPEDPDDGLDSLELMVAALKLAADDAGVPLAEIDSLAIVDQISFHHLGKLCEPLAAAIGASPAINYQSAAPHGDTPRSEEHTSELQSPMRISSAVFCL